MLSINISELTKQFFPCYPNRHYSNEVAATILEALPESVTDFVFKLCEGYDSMIMENHELKMPPIFSISEIHRDMILNNPIIGTIFNERYFPFPRNSINTSSTEHEGHD